ncbi:hypothetical protein [Variovorax terrae]|uniref:Uncharacterized protein n=1 Tax=Variovorax terrae TaxID=2923278 RepID=A0A9X1VVR3_9BURK|nr:hypothetical protein [Variovorax terrae]MCJ0762767.1 hypothetical protein [Variovorax terrae]
MAIHGDADGVRRTAGCSASFPGAGIDRLPGGKAPIRTGWFANLVRVF